MGDWIWVMIPLTALMIPIVVVLTKHQQKMAEILNRNTGDHAVINGLRQEIAEIKALVHHQTIALDNIRGTQKSLDPPPAPPTTDPLGLGS
jgi:hypothetical protein